MKLFLWLLGLGCMLTRAPAAPDTVVLLHGLGRTSLSMARLAHGLEADGYHVINATYPSRTRPLEELAGRWLPDQLRRVPAGSRVHFVTHSMGGIIVRLWLRDHGAPPLPGRVVMLAPPNAGSPLPDQLARFGPFRWFTGVNGARLGTRGDDLPQALGGWPAHGGELGIVAGDCSINPLLGTGLPSPNDGKVAVAATHLAGEADHVVLPYSHTWIGWRRGTLAAVRSFLRDGRFPPHGAVRPWPAAGRS